MSPSFGAPEFRHFRAACQAARREQPSLTVNGLRTLLHVAAAAAPLSYQDLAERLGHGYEQTAHQIAALADGRAGRAGLGLLQRRAGPQDRMRAVTCTDRGRALAGRFPFGRQGPLTDEEAAGQIHSRVLPALEAILQCNPGLTLGTLCVFLSIAGDPERFAYDGEPARVIAEELGLSNLPKHLSVLEHGIEGDARSRLVEFQVNEYDQRIRLPRLAPAGLALACAVVAALTGRPAAPPRLPRPEALDRLDSPQDIHLLDDEDFDDIQWDPPA